ncbi:unnamed protein product [Adineta ricciae]|uniref:Dynamin N-terminal domain-containing protein n=1 Tax=Adineta ricciae TaxID=249248 RepID=A0A813YPH3_ADIRI|nr:unnamed protein product [Adineta ricciae]CAF1248726.1 unnamed protein product [Adineta ricciae]
MEGASSTRFVRSDLNDLASSDENDSILHNDDGLRKTWEKSLIDPAIFKAYQNLRNIVVERGLEKELIVPRIVFVGDTSAGKSMLVQMFLQFPSVFSQANVGTRCPVQYVLRYDPTLADDDVHIIRPRGWRPQDLGRNLQQEMIRIENDHKSEGGFRILPFVVEIASKHYTDIEILDLPGLISGDRDKNKRAAVERITEYYVRDPSFMIVQLKEAQQLVDNTYGMLRIDELCTAEPALWGSKLPARKNYAQHMITIQTKFDAFMLNHDNGSATNEDIRTRIHAFPNSYFTNMVFDLYNFADHSYDENVRYIAEVPEREKEAVDNWIDRINTRANSNESLYQLFNQEYRSLIGIDVVRKKIQDLWSQAFRNAIPELLQTVDRLIQQSNLKHKKALSNLKQQDPKAVRGVYLNYIEEFRKTISNYAAYRAEVNNMFPLNEYGRTYEEIEMEYNEWNRKQPLTWRAYLSSEQLKQIPGKKELEALNSRYVGAYHFGRLQEVFSYMVRSHGTLDRESDWFESSQSLLYGVISDNKNTEKAIRESIFTLIRETFLIGVCWLTQMYAFLTDHFSSHVKSALLDRKFPDLQDHVKFLSLVDLEYHGVTRTFIRNAVTAIRQERYLRMVYVTYDLCETLKKLVKSFSSMANTIENNHDNDNADDDQDNERLGEQILNSAKDAVSKIVTGTNPGMAIATSVASHLCADKTSKTNGYVQPRDKVAHLYLTIQIQGYKSKSIENSLQNRLQHMSDRNVARMANINIKRSRQEVFDAREEVDQLEETRDSIENVKSLLDNEYMNGKRLNANSDKNRRIRVVVANKRDRELHDIEKKLKIQERHKRKTKQNTQHQVDDQVSTFDTIENDKEFSIESDLDEDSMSENEDEHELMQYDDKTSSETYLLGIFRAHDEEDLRLGFLEGDSLDADVEFVQQRQQQQENERSSVASNIKMNIQTTNQISEEHITPSLPPSSSVSSEHAVVSTTVAANDNEAPTEVTTSQVVTEGTLIHTGSVLSELDSAI